MRTLMPNQPTAGHAGIASRLETDHHWPGVPEPGRSAESRNIGAHYLKHHSTR